MKVISVLLLSLFILTFPGCKNATGSFDNISTEDLLGTWQVNQWDEVLSLTTTVTTDIVDPASPGTGSLLVDGQDVGLQFVKIFNAPHISRINTIYDGIEILDHPSSMPDIDGDTWNYSLTNAVGYYSHLNHLWGQNPQVFAQWDGYHPDFSFSSGGNYLFTLHDTLTRTNPLTNDTILVTGSIVPATIHVTANHPAQVMSTSSNPDDEHFCFAADGTFEYWTGLGPSEGGTWTITNGRLQLNFIGWDAEGNEQITEMMYWADIVNDQLTLHYLGDACDTYIPSLLTDCHTIIAADYWPLEGDDISDATADITVVMTREDLSLRTRHSVRGELPSIH